MSASFSKNATDLAWREVIQTERNDGPSSEPLPIDLHRFEAATQTISPLESLRFPTGIGRRVSSAVDLENFDPEVKPALGIALSFRSSLPSATIATPMLGNGLAQDDPFASNSNLLSLPEPASIVLLITGFVGVWARRHLQRKRRISSQLLAETARTEN
jgi:hypothetical protein